MLFDETRELSDGLNNTLHLFPRLSSPLLHHLLAINVVFLALGHHAKTSSISSGQRHAGD